MCLAVIYPDFVITPSGTVEAARYRFKCCIQSEAMIIRATISKGETWSRMWQKERIINRCVSQLPDYVKHVAWVDADVIIARPDIWKITEHMLQRQFDVVQLWSHGIWTDRDYKAQSVMTSFAAAKVLGIRPDRRAMRSKHPEHPGFAWAARRDVFPLLDWSILGSGDNLMCHAWAGKPCMTGQLSTGCLLAYEEYKASVQGIRLGCVPGTLTHLYHGDWNNRGYVRRWQILREHEFDPQVDIKLSSDGLWEWASDKPALHEAVRDYFPSRKEDE